MNYWLLFALVVASYLLGNISFGRIVSATRNVDITKQGSGNPGMTNVMRTHGAKLGILVLVLDALKGAIPALVGVFAFGGYVQSDYPLYLTGTAESYTALFACGFASMLGHIFPVFWKFKGGKGVATFVGIFFVAQPIWSLIIFALAIISLLLFKLMSLTSIGLLIALVVIQCIYVPQGNNLAIWIILALMVILIIYAHRSNISRLIKGTENVTDLQEAIKKDKLRVKQEIKDKKIEIKNEYKQNKQEYKEDNITKEDLKQNKLEYKHKIEEIKQERKTQLNEIKHDKKEQMKELKKSNAKNKLEETTETTNDEDNN
ncbi:MAG: glycerol-3-phosphate 1-O-acyltransferase PlsY [Clostridia bacterium]|nr:glycerol-3-phosphate 1-O-acyltransferase PlsY [Clostridia bacterium]